MAGEMQTSQSYQQLYQLQRQPQQQQQFAQVSQLPRSRTSGQQLHLLSRPDKQPRPSEETNKEMLAGSASNSPTPSEFAGQLGASDSEDPSKHNAVMGIFFKVWSLVKVSKVRHQNKMRQQASEDFRYFGADQLAGQHQQANHPNHLNSTAGQANQWDQSGRPSALLVQADFRRAGSQPAAPMRPSQLAGSVSANSPAGSSVRRHLSAYSLRPARSQQPEGVAGKSGPSAVSWAERMRIRRSATGLGQHQPTGGLGNRQGARLASCSTATTAKATTPPTTAPPTGAHSPAPAARASVRRKSDPLAGSPQHRPSERDQSADALNDHPDGATADDDDDDDDEGDIYSTPNDSIQSVQMGADKLGRLPSISRSFSTSSFLANGRAGAPSRHRESVKQQQQKADRSISGSRFFISSSSSEDSNSASAQPAAALAPARKPAGEGAHQAPRQAGRRQATEPAAPESPEEQQQAQALQLTVQRGVHAHLAVQPGVPALEAICEPSTPLSAFQARGLWKKSPSLFEMSAWAAGQQPPSQQSRAGRFASRWPMGAQLGAAQAAQLARNPRRLSTFGQLQAAAGEQPPALANSVSLHADCRLSSPESVHSEYRLAQMLLEFGSNSSARDESGCTALMHAILSDNLPALRCLIEHGANLDETNGAGQTAIELLCSRAPTSCRLEMLQLLIERRPAFDRARNSDNSRLIDRLIAEHQPNSAKLNRLAYVDRLLHNGAKLGSSTWLCARGKEDVQVRLLRKLCQDGYALYRDAAIEQAVYRFEYALKRIAELELQLMLAAGRPSSSQATRMAARQLKYQTYLGLSRCERRRRFFKRALEFAHMAILVDSSAYEAFYSKANILRDLGETDEAMVGVEQSGRLVDEALEALKGELAELEQREESLLLDGCLGALDFSTRSDWVEQSRAELVGQLEYLLEARRHIGRLREQLMQSQLAGAAAGRPGQQGADKLVAA